MDSAEISELKSILVDHWENAFHVVEMGSQYQIYVELEDTEEKINLWNHIPMKFNKKYVLIFKVPTGYIDGFLRSKTKN